MSVGNFLIAGILLLLDLKLKRRGQIGACYLILYSAGRFAVEFLRFDHRGSVGPFSTSQFISLFVFVVGVALLIWSSLKGKKKEEN
jgi:phosphatidylglycerol:prolipoprotein diacylglycerol transferase